MQAHIFLWNLFLVMDQLEPSIVITIFKASLLSVAGPEKAYINAGWILFQSSNCMVLCY